MNSFLRVALEFNILIQYSKSSNKSIRTHDFRAYVPGDKLRNYLQQ